MRDRATLNKIVLERIQRVLKKKPDANLLDLVRIQYEKPALRDATRPATCFSGAGSLNGVSYTVLFPLSETAESTIQDLAIRQQLDPNSGDSLGYILEHLLPTLESLRPEGQEAGAVLRRCGDELVVKISRCRGDITEAATLQYLAHHHPNIPAPKFHGLLQKGADTYLFMSLIEGRPLSDLWDSLSSGQKGRLRDQLERFLEDLRSSPRPTGGKFGGASQTRCKDTRRNTRIADDEINDMESFLKFYLTPRVKIQPSYFNCIRSALPSRRACVLFTHGDLRPENILVAHNGVDYEIKALVDWENSGWYPDWWETVKATNNLTPVSNDDWWNYLPRCISVERYRAEWTFDCMWDRYVV